MIGALGQWSLTLAVLASTVGLLATVYAARFDVAGPLRLARLMLAGMAVCFTTASAALMLAMVNDQFQFQYVSSYSEKALPLGYKLAAFWAGQEGSLLLWAWLLGAMSAAAAYIHRAGMVRGQAALLGTLLLVSGFFAMLMVFAANPFAVLPHPPLDGRGLNPMLQDPGMLAHPPLLFIGYAGYTIPFAMLIAALVSDPTSNAWIAATRRWTLIAWLFLSIGIILGAQWAYVELGWGGYWAWDPVENASLLPWLTSTAVLHSMMVQVRRGMFRRWNAVLIAVTFVLCIFGTYLTRSGVVGSVHTFGESVVGNFFLGFLLTIIAGTAGLIAWRYKQLSPEHPLTLLISREGAFLAGNVLLSVITATTLIGTIFPLISGLFRAEPITLKQSFYNTVVVPMGLLLLGLMAMGPVLKAGQDAAEKMGKVIIAPTVFGCVVALGALAAGIRNFWALGCVFVTSAATYSLLADFAASVALRMRNTKENPLLAAIRLFDGDHRRYGGQMTHIGMILMAVGITGSSLYGLTETLQLRPGETKQIAHYLLTLEKLHEVKEVNFDAVEAVVTMKDDQGHTVTLNPQRRFYHKYQDMPNSEVALQSTLREDLYVTLAGWEQGGQVVALQVIVNPLVIWMWIGGIVLSLGGIVCLLPRMLPQAHPAAAPAGVEPRSRRAAAAS